MSSKRRPRKQAELKRKKPIREMYDKVLILCEGKTECSYFKGLLKKYELSSINIKIDVSLGSAPISNLRHAKKLSESAKKNDDPFDRIYCVFDRDKHKSFDDTLSQISEKPRELKIYASTSDPCFEYWVLLHYKFTDRPYKATGKKSACELVINDIRKYMPDYAKNSTDLFSKLWNNLEEAKNNASKIQSRNTDGDFKNPSTNLHELVEYLQNIKK